MDRINCRVANRRPALQHPEMLLKRSSGSQVRHDWGKLFDGGDIEVWAYRYKIRCRLKNAGYNGIPQNRINIRVCALFVRFGEECPNIAEEIVSATYEELKVKY